MAQGDLPIYPAATTSCQQKASLEIFTSTGMGDIIDKNQLRTGLWNIPYKPRKLATQFR